MTRRRTLLTVVLFGLVILTTRCARTSAAPDRRRPVRDRTVYVVLFGSTSCPECKPGMETVKQAVKDMKGVELVIRDVDLNSDFRLFQFLARRSGLDPTKTVAAPSVFVDTDYLDMRYRGGWQVRRLVRKYRMIGTGRFYENTDIPRDNPRLAYLERLSRFSAVPVVLGALTDGVSPWALMVMLLAVPVLVRRIRRSRELLFLVGFVVLGALVASGVVCLEAAVGLRVAMLRLNQQGTVCSLSALLCVALGVAALRTAQRLWSETDEDEEGEPSSGETLRQRGERARHWARRHPLLVGALASVSAGAGLALTELTCTQQVYLPTLLQVIETSGPTRQIGLYLGEHVLGLAAPFVVALSLARLAGCIGRVRSAMETSAVPLGWVKGAAFFILAVQLVAAGAR